MPHLTRSTWILLAGLVVAGAVLGAGAINTKRLQHRAEMASICDLPAPPSNHADIDLVEAWLKAGNVSTGDPDADAALAKSGASTHDTGEAVQAARAAGLTIHDPVQECYAEYGQVGENNEAVRASKEWARPCALVIAILCALPWAWYFLLRRIAELRAAIGGQPPSG